jgi:hypothetical protein
VQRQGCWPETELPGFLAVRWRCGNGAPLVHTREGADKRAPDGFASLPWIRGQGSPPRRKVDGSADDIALNPCCVERSEGKPPIADQGFVVCQLLVGPLEQARLYVGFTRIGRLAPYAETGYCQTLRPNRPNARRDAQWNGR